MSAEATSSWPRPFYDDGLLDYAWSRRRRAAARALWHWHTALTSSDLGEEGEGPSVEEEQARAEAGAPLRSLPESVCREAYAACEAHDLNRRWLALQVQAAPQLQGATRFETPDALEQFVQHWAVPHGRLLAQLAGVTMTVQYQHADELARGFFYLARLLRLPADLAEDRLFLPLETLRERGVTVEQLRSGSAGEAVQGLLWREAIRIRDALAQGRSLMAALSLRHRFYLKRAWMGALELLDVLDRRDYDLWDRPPTLTMTRRIRVYLRTFFGRTDAR